MVVMVVVVSECRRRRRQRPLWQFRNALFRLCVFQRRRIDR